MTTVLAIESSCDETGVGIARLDADGTVTLLADEVASSVDEHVRFGGVRGVAVSGRRIGQYGHPADLAARLMAPLLLIASLCIVAARLIHGISLPGFMIPAGSSVALTARNTSTPKSPTSSVIQGR